MARRLSTLARLPVTELTGLGPKSAEGLAEAFGVETVLDLLTHYPRRWIDRTKEARIRDLRVGDEAMVVGEVRRITARRTRGRPPRVLVTADITDGSGHLNDQRNQARQLVNSTRLTRGDGGVRPRRIAHSWFCGSGPDGTKEPDSR